MLISLCEFKMFEFLVESCNDDRFLWSALRELNFNQIQYGTIRASLTDFWLWECENLCEMVGR